MDWSNLIYTMGGSTLIIGVLEWIRYRKKDSADARSTAADADGKATDNALRYADHVEEKLSKMEERVDRMEAKISIFQRAINCAYRCKQVTDPEQDCPVLLHLTDENNDKGRDTEGDQ